MFKQFLDLTLNEKLLLSCSESCRPLSDPSRLRKLLPHDLLLQVREGLLDLATWHLQFVVAQAGRNQSPKA